MNRPKVLIAVDKPIDPRGGGGVGVWVDLVRRGLEARGHEVLVAGPAGAGVTVLLGDDADERARSLAGLCAEREVEAVLSASSDTARLAAPRLPEGCRHIATVHSAKPSHVSRETGRVQNLTDALVGCSRSVAAEIARQARDRSRVFCVPNGLPPEGGAVVPRTERPKVVTVVGRLEVEQKRSHWLPRVHEALHRLDPETRMTVIGGGSLLPRLEGYARSTEGFEVLGPLSRDEVAAYLRTTPRVLFTPSAYEGLSFVVLEALTAGSLVVLSGDPQVTGGAVDSRHAILLELGRSLFLDRTTTRCLARELRRALTTNDDLENRVERATRRVREAHSLEAMARGYSEVVEATVARPAARRREGVRAAPYRRRPLESAVARLALAWEDLRPTDRF